jgi:hypothetical protein
LRLTVFAFAPPQRRGESRAEYEFRRSQAEVVARLVDTLTAVTLPGFLGSAPAPCGAADQYELTDVAGELFFQVRDDGRLAALAMDPRTESPQLDRALLHAALRADSQRLLAPLPRPLRGTPVDIRLRVRTARPTGAESRAVAKFALPYVPIDSPAVLLPGYRRPRWPAAAGFSMPSDSIVVRFVVNQSGVPDVASLQFLSGTWRGFAQEVVASVSSSRFRPPSSGGCPVPQRFQWTFVWTVRDR